MNSIKKIIVLLMLVILILPATNVIAAIPQEIQEEENKTMPLEYTIFKEDGSQIVQEIIVDANDIATFNEIIPQIFEKITSTGYCNITEIINGLIEKFGQNKILSTILGIRPLQKRVFIISNGYGPKFDIRLKRDISIHKIFNLWLYLRPTSYSINSKTLIIDPIPDAQLQFYRLIDGQQIGLMTRFTGFYIRIPSNLIEQTQSHTFFIGYAVKVRAFDLPDVIE